METRMLIGRRFAALKCESRSCAVVRLESLASQPPNPSRRTSEASASDQKRVARSTSETPMATIPICSTFRLCQCSRPPKCRARRTRRRRLGRRDRTTDRIGRRHPTTLRNPLIALSRLGGAAGRTHIRGRDTARFVLGRFLHLGPLDKHDLADLSRDRAVVTA